MPDKQSTTPNASPVTEATDQPLTLPSAQEFRQKLREQARQGLQHFLEKVMDEELDELLDCGWGESSPTRKGYRNGHYTRTLLTSQGPISDLQVPRDREGQFHSQVFEQYHRAEPQLEEALVEMFVAGASQEKVGQITKTLTGAALSDSAVSRLSQSLTEEYESWRKRPLAAHYQIIYLDAVYFSIRYGDSASRMAILTALGVTVEGHKEVLALRSSAAESQEAWAELLNDLRKRGVEKVTLFVSDGSGGIIAAVNTVFPSSLRQRCLVHKHKDILSHIPKPKRAEIAPQLSGIWNAANQSEALTQLAAFKVRYGKLYPEALRSLEEDESQSLSFYALEPKWWKFARTNNAIESLFSGVRNRTNPIKAFTTEDSAVTIVWAATQGIKLAKLPLTS
jgi:putative transposase